MPKVKEQARCPKTIATITEKEYEEFFEQSVWAYCRDVERVIRPFSTDDFVRDYFIPDLC